MLFFVFFWSFSLSGWIFFGAQLDEFSTLGESLFAVLEMILGNINIQALQEAHKEVALLFVIPFMILFSYLLMNVFFAIMDRCYQKEDAFAALVSLAAEDPNIVAKLKTGSPAARGGGAGAGAAGRYSVQRGGGGSPAGRGSQTGGGRGSTVDNMRSSMAGAGAVATGLFEPMKGAVVEMATVVPMGTKLGGGKAKTGFLSPMKKKAENQKEIDADDLMRHGFDGPSRLCCNKV